MKITQQQSEILLPYLKAFAERRRLEMLYDGYNWDLIKTLDLQDFFARPGVYRVAEEAKTEEQQ